MAVIQRSSGITIETNGYASLGEAPGVAHGGFEGGLPAPQARRRRGRPARAELAEGTETDLLISAFGSDEVTLVDRIPLRADDLGTDTPMARRRRRRAAEAGATLGTMVSVVDFTIPLDPGEEAVVLVEQDGVYSWHTGQVEADGAAPAAPARRKRRTRKKKAVTPPVARRARIRIDLAPMPAATPDALRRRRRRGFPLKAIVGKAVAYVFRFVAKPILKGVASWMERKIQDGIVHVTGADPALWNYLGPTATIPGKLDATRAPRILLLVHGTFSSTVGSFGGLGSTTEGRGFLTEALKQYDLILGWDHRTLTQAPDENAKDLLRWFGKQAWPHPPEIDAIAFSRGGLVYRSIVEMLLPGVAVSLRFRRAVFVGCTNGGTELARPENWHRFADRYTNLAAAGSRALGRIPGFMSASKVFEGAIRGVSALIKSLATAAVTDKAVPGLAAMNPDGSFVKTLNQKQFGQPTVDGTYYCAVTSDFDPDLARDEGRSEEIPPGLLLSLADTVTDQLYGKPNDLVVHVEGMTQIDPAAGSYVRERLDFGTNGVVHHCRYFLQEDTAESLVRWLTPTVA